MGTVQTKHKYSMFRVKLESPVRQDPFSKGQKGINTMAKTPTDAEVNADMIKFFNKTKMTDEERAAEIDTGMYNDIIEGYAILGMRSAGLSGPVVKEIVQAIHSNFDFIPAAQAIQSERIGGTDLKEMDRQRPEPEAVNKLCDTGAVNNIIKGYNIIALDRAGISDDLKSQIMQELYHALDENTAAQAREAAERR